ncbi:Methicillin resistance protein [Chloroherpeton thalassium ATCC 35110]|uniref:Methicillin resistance protein n=1 Tax=Chloroherpeton thalassium (strain ATCC 35110 / GB-78) TaxID=517418 RepID=B3QXM1_CHLT3|nr:peptidoglycan bridge formation glycyltransferase FemA/FemB family protein [Chloroherpeton thalassium]ACF14936.1 Methicillin resistance protein [Chloroherpeton thalassium ATCC 35110]
MICRVEKKEIEEIKPTNILTQTPFWARVKHEQGYFPNGYHLTISKDILNPNATPNLKIQDDLLVLIKRVSASQCFAYVPYGPKLEPKFEQQGVFLEALSEVLRPFFPKNCVFIRYDLMWENQWAKEDNFFDSSGNWVGPPPHHTQEFRVNFNTTQWNLKKSPRDILPKNTFFLDLTKKEHELLHNMRYNTRYNIRQSERKGIRIKEYGIEKLDEWYDLYTETAIRNNMILHDKQYFSTILTNQDSDKNGVNVSLLMAEDEDEFLASMFLVLSRKRGTYLFGASSSSKRHLMASYGLQWEAIKKSKKYGCSEYDMFGCAPNLNRTHPLHGVHVYKKGFGGKIYHRMGCWDYPYMKKDYELIKALEVNN